ncbi:MAG TPA: sensor histidine kinase [Nocardioides sp.]|nr:sensor histidine kinase [Nocardioides sp.]
MVRALKHPVAQFLAAGFVTLVLVLVATGRLSGTAAADEAIDDAVATTELLARSVAEPALPRGLVDGDQGALDRFDARVLERLMVQDVERVKIWDARGRIVYSDQTRLIGDTYELGASERAVLESGDLEAEQSDLAKEENRYERSSGGLLEVYTRIWSPEGEPLLFEVYYSAAEIEARRAEVLGAFRPITVGALLTLLALTTPLVWVLTRRLRRASDDRERLLRAAVEASDAERRRIARDLHDTVVQDLSGTAFALAAAAREGGAPSSTLDSMAGSLRDSLRSLRSLLVEIHPPDLGTVGLAGALQDLVAPAAARGVEAQLDTAGLGTVDREAAALVWRVAQEAVRNVLRHADASTLRVSVSGEGTAVRLVVEDDGKGFDPGEARDRTSFGLRGLADLVEESGGSLRVTAAPGRGTRVAVELGAA